MLFRSVVMDEAEIGEQAIVAASAFVRAGMKVPARSLLAGVPGKVIRPLTAQEMAWKHEGTLTYQRLAVRCHASLLEVTPLEHADRSRARLVAERLQPLIANRR